MFQIGDLIIYGAHGVCRIDDICEKTFYGMTKKYYIFHPIEDKKLRISLPVNNDSVSMSRIMDKEQAKKILQSFNEPGVTWIPNNTERQKFFNNVISNGDRENIAQMLNTLLRKKREVESEGKKLGASETNLLTSIQKTMFSELAIALNTSYEDIEDRVTGMTVS